MASVCVFCSSAVGIDDRYVELAAAVGRRLAAGGHRLISGGGRVSMMGAVATQSRAGGAHTIGVIPEHLMRYEVADTDADELLVVDTMRERKALMEAHSDAFLVLPGGIGTLEEFFEVWTSGSLGMHPKPVVVVDSDAFFAPLWAFLQALTDQGFVRPSAWNHLWRVTTVEAAFTAIEALDAGRPGRAVRHPGVGEADDHRPPRRDR